ncbi:MAG: hypothetical protein ABSF92_03465 [Candidatus Acidiferrales bacterium]|jgi:hypothetical protein
MKNLDEAFYDVGYEAMKIKNAGLVPETPSWEKFSNLVDELVRAEREYLESKGSIPRYADGHRCNYDMTCCNPPEGKL